jgi:hypothetical protein
VKHQLLLRARAAGYVIACAAALVALPAQAAIRDQNMAPPLPITFSDGAVATPSDHCGDGDLCALIAYKGGDELRIFSEGAAFCQPYLVHFVRVHEGKLLFEYSRALNHEAPSATGFGPRCGNNLATQMTLDRGLVHLTVDEYPDGTLRFQFDTIAPK